MKLSKSLLAIAISATLISANAMADAKHSEEKEEVVLGSANQSIAATVNGKPISQLAADRVAEQLAAQGQNANLKQILDELINLEILTQAAEAKNLDKEAEVATALELQYTQTMANAYLAAFSQDLKIGEPEIRAEYDKQIAALDATSEYRASHILLESESDAKEIIEELANGADFSAIAKTRSTGPTGANGGDLGWFDPNSMVPEFSAAVSEMKKGESSTAPVQTDFGWHVIKLVDTREGAKPDYSTAVKAGIENTLLRNALAEHVDELRTKANIEMK